jgi:HlyD family secretion protein
MHWTQRQLALATTTLLSAAVGVAAARPDIAIDVETATVSRGPVAHQIVATGALRPVATIDVTSQVSGIVQALNADVNTTVRAGDIVARLDPSLFETALRDAEAAREQVRTSVLVTQPEVQAVAAENADEAVRAAANALERTIIRAPVDGIVVVRNVDVGETVTASPESPVLLRIAVDLHDMQIAVDASESDLSRVRSGAPATLTIAPYGDETFHGEVSRVTRDSAIVEVPNPDERLRPGMSAALVINGPHHDDTVRVPDAALMFQPPADAGAIVDAADLDRDEEGATSGMREVWRYSRGRLTPVAVAVGLSGGGWTEVLSDVLQPGDEIATGVVARRESPLEIVRRMMAGWLP